MQVLQDVFHFIEENNFVSTREFLKLCRYCKILSNSVDWNILMSVLKKNLAIQGIFLFQIKLIKRLDTSRFSKNEF